MKPIKQSFLAASILAAFLAPAAAEKEVVANAKAIAGAIAKQFPAKFA